MKSDFKAVKAVQIIFGAIILSCCIFWGIYGIGVNGLTIFFNNSRYIYDHESPYVQEFQQYVSQNNIATSDISECDEWMDYHCVLFCIIEKDGEAVYSKLNVDKFIVSAKNMYDSRKIAKYQLPVNFADGEANVYIYAGYTEKYYLGVIILGIVISILSGAYVHLFLFAKKGFTQGCIEEAGKMGNVSLVTYDQIYEYLKDRGITAF